MTDNVPSKYRDRLFSMQRQAAIRLLENPELTVRVSWVDEKGKPHSNVTAYIPEDTEQPRNKNHIVVDTDDGFRTVNLGRIYNLQVQKMA